MSRLIVVSNRVAPINESKSAAGGLAVGVLAALRESGGVWFGWSGEVVATPSGEPRLFDSGRLSYATLDLNEQDYEEYYNGFANRVLWPLFHHRIDLVSYARRDLAGYLRVNLLFASKLLALLQDDDMVWAHDYHLIPIADMLRRGGFDGRIGFFLHTPFPACEILVTLPGHRDLVRALCAFDVVGLQTRRDLKAFHDYIVNEANGRVAEDGIVHAFGRTLRAAAFPIGIDAGDVARLARVAATSDPVTRLRTSIGGRDLIIGVDRLDYSKGLVQRFLAFEQLLEHYPANRKRVTFLQIAPPTRSGVPEYVQIRRDLEETAGRVNGRFAEFDWVPIRYLNRNVARRTLAGFFRLARVGLVTPLRDGMNLVAKEFVAAQDPADPGVVVLSRFAGAAEQMRSALIVNPYDTDEMSNALQTALDMKADERLRRWQALAEDVAGHDIHDWRRNFIAALAAAPHG